MQRTTMSLLAVALLSCGPASAAGALDPLLHGALVFHGNYCGPGNRGVHPAPVDALDAACMRHDACTTRFEIPTCGCNGRLARAAARIARDSRAPAAERRDADFTARGAVAMTCK